MVRLGIAIGVCLLASCSTVVAAEKGLVGYWSFDEGKGAVARDSGRGHHGRIHGAVFEKSPKGHALRFDGVDDFVDCGTKPRFDFGNGGTILLWYRPEALQGGLVNWSTGSAWADEGLVVAVSQRVHECDGG